MKHIDTHIHMYPEKLMKAIYGYFQRLGWEFPCCGNVEETLLHLQENEVEKAFLLLYAHKPGMALEINRWAYELCRKNPHIYPFGCFFPDDDNPEANVRKCLRDWGFSGMKLHFSVQPAEPDDPRYFPVYRQALEYGRGVIMHIGSFPDQSGNQPGTYHLQKVLKRFPGLKVIVAHMGCYRTEDFWRLMDRNPGVYLDTSFILGNPQFPDGHTLVADSLARFPHRILYGSDFPLIRHRLSDGLDYITLLPWDEKTKNNLLRENALRFLTQSDIAACKHL
ncbi:amidohydrolase family protein [Dethiobacter alkaliphilus]|uniref:amidohydrolase family protein n=1 Tax=Dethiobacter alkaliphilus TaxID=427926 RepID=UPI002226C316|nr:amidohydrolase family protein [Dethiobacter alkaliphilus]MCW3491162.1 amidohydrolase family protein [Dethiobacter alkaliphilus]